MLPIIVSISESCREDINQIKGLSVKETWIVPAQNFMPTWKLRMWPYLETVFADTTELRLSWMRVGPKSNDWCPSVKKRMHREEEKKGTWRQRNYAAAGQAMAGPPGAGKGKEAFFPRAFRGSVPLLCWLWFQTADFSPQNCDTCCFKPLSLW